MNEFQNNMLCEALWLENALAMNNTQTRAVLPIFSFRILFLSLIEIKHTHFRIFVQSPKYR